MKQKSNRQDMIDVFLETNSKLNLSAIRDPEGVYQKHILDSLELTQFNIIKPGDKVIDVGTWGGFPLMPLARYYKDNQFFWLDARKKKIVAINGMLRELGIHNAKALRGRAEEHKERYDVLTARAVAYADKLLPWIHKLVKSGWYFVLYKPDSPGEFDVLDRQCDRYGLVITYIHKYSLFEWDITRILYIIKKE